MAPSIVIKATLFAAAPVAHTSQRASPVNAVFIPIFDTFSNYHFRADEKGQDSPMDPYTKPNERKIGAQRPKISHLPDAVETRTRKERQAEKQAVAAERRAIKKAARRHLKDQLISDLEEDQ